MVGAVVANLLGDHWRRDFFLDLFLEESTLLWTSRKKKKTTKEVVSLSRKSISSSKTIIFSYSRRDQNCPLQFLVFHSFHNIPRDDHIGHLGKKFNQNHMSIFSHISVRFHLQQESLINLDWFTEYLTSVSGYIVNDLGSTIIHSLTFQSNKRTYGPFGTETGRKFSFPATGGKIIGFYGSSGSHLQSLGAYFKPISHLYPIKCSGPFGGQGGNPWDDGKFNGVKKIKMMLENVVNCISFEYDANGESVWSFTHGHSGNGEIHMVNLDYPREFLTSISGYIRHDYPVIQSVTFESNIGTHGPFGKEEGRFFSCELTCSKIIGFHGRSGVQLDALGVYSKPICDHCFLKPIGPFGGQGGSPWDDGDSLDVREIIIKAGLVIDSLTVEYDKNGSVVQSPKHGGNGGHKTLQIKLDYPREYLTSFSGYFGYFCGCTIVCSLTFQSNERAFGPIGVENGKYFCFPSTGRKIIGFHGRFGLYLDSLGAHFET